MLVSKNASSKAFQGGMPSFGCTNRCGTSRYPALNLPHVTRMILDVTATKDPESETFLTSCANILVSKAHNISRARFRWHRYVLKVFFRSVLNHGLFWLRSQVALCSTDKRRRSRRLSSANLARRLWSYPVVWSWPRTCVWPPIAQYHTSLLNLVKYQSDIHWVRKHFYRNLDAQTASWEFFVIELDLVC